MVRSIILKYFPELLRHGMEWSRNIDISIEYISPCPLMWDIDLSCPVWRIHNLSDNGLFNVTHCCLYFCIHSQSVVLYLTYHPSVRHKCEVNTTEFSASLFKDLATFHSLKLGSTTSHQLSSGTIYQEMRLRWLYRDNSSHELSKFIIDITW